MTEAISAEVDRPAADRPGARSEAVRRPAWLPTAVVAALALAVFWAAHDALIDDAYITLAYAKNLALHGHWGMVPGHVANTATSPLNVLALAGLTLVLRHGLLAVGALLLLSTIGLEYGLRRVGAALGLRAWFSVGATALCLFSPVTLSSVGMEVMPMAGLTSLLLMAVIERRSWLIGLAAGLLVVTRADQIVIVAALVLLRRQPFGGLARAALVAVPVAAAWYVTSWFTLGSAVPATLVIKTVKGPWAGYGFATGPLIYLRNEPAATVLSALPVIIGALLAIAWLIGRRRSETLRRLDRLACLPAGATAYYVAYSTLGVPPCHWYYAPTVLGMSIYVVAGLTVWPRAVKVPAGALAVVLLVLVAAYAKPGLPRVYAQFETNHASTQQYRTAALAIARIVGDQPVAGPPEVGILDYYCGCEIDDYFSDPGYFPSWLATYENGMGPIGQHLVNWDFHWFNRAQQPEPTRYKLVEAQTVPAGALGAWPIDTTWPTVPHMHWLVLLPNS